LTLDHRIASSLVNIIPDKGFMGKEWDGTSVALSVDFWREVYRVLKPGGVLLSFGGTRTYHRITSAIEDAGFAVEDSIHWVFGQGFPKHKSKLKPAHEPIVLARKPGAKWLGVDECRVGATVETWPASRSYGTKAKKFNTRDEQEAETQATGDSPAGRWPPNLVLSHGPDCTESGCDESCPVRLMGEQSGELTSGNRKAGDYRRLGGDGRFSEWSVGPMPEVIGDSGTAARFFPCFDHDPFIYAAKASRRDRNDGCEGMESHACGMMEDDNYPIKTGSGNLRDTRRQNHHPTVKSVHLMRWLCRLACPKGGTILDPFAGSGSTGKAAMLEGFRFIGIEKDPEYYEIARRRIYDPHPLFAGLEDDA
jgi:site-specific DNA-methyltransferase (adenine-specific)